MHDPRYSQLAAALLEPAFVTEQWMDCYESSRMRIPKAVDRASMSSSVAVIVETLANLVGPDRDGRIQDDLSFRAGADHLKEVEKAISFVAARLGASGFTCFDVCGLILALRDVLCQHLQGSCEVEMKTYMEWLTALAADSLATSREQAAKERWHFELDEGTPVIMVTAELPAALFVCKPDGSVAAGVLGRLLLSVVRTGAKAVIIDVSGMSGRLELAFADSLERFLSHAKIAGAVTVFARGVHADDVSSWQEIATRSGAKIIFEEYFDVCVTESLKIANWRLLHSS